MPVICIVLLYSAIWLSTIYYIRSVYNMWLIIIVKNFWSFWWLSFENCNFICSVTYTSFNVLDKLFLSCSLPDFQNSNPVMFTPLHIRYYWLYLTPKLSKNLKIRKFQILSKNVRLMNTQNMFTSWKNGGEHLLITSNFHYR